MVEVSSNEAEGIPVERSPLGVSLPREVRSARKGIAFVVLDTLEGLIVVGGITALAVAVAAPIATQPGLITLGIWTALSSIAALPALVVLHLSPPRIPLKDRSALFSSAKWFGGAVWSAVVFSVSIVLGTMTGLVASRATGSEQDLAVALGSAFSATAQIAVWPILAGVAALAYVVMGVRWLIDLGKIADGGEAHDVWVRLEQRWFQTTGPTLSRGQFRPFLSWLLASVVGRFGLIATLLTVGLDVAITWTTLVRS